VAIADVCPVEQIGREPEPFIQCHTYICWLTLLSKRQLTTIFSLIIGLSYARIIPAPVLFLREEMDYVENNSIIPLSPRGRGRG